MELWRGDGRRKRERNTESAREGNFRECSGGCGLCHRGDKPPGEEEEPAAAGEAEEGQGAALRHGFWHVDAQRSPFAALTRPRTTTHLHTPTHDARWWSDHDLDHSFAISTYVSRPFPSAASPLSSNRSAARVLSVRSRSPVRKGSSRARRQAEVARVGNTGLECGRVGA